MQFITAALTHDHHAFKRGRYFYSDSFGLVTLLLNNTVHKIAQVTGNRREFATFLCWELDIVGGHLIRGPWLRLYRSRFSLLTSRCDAEMHSGIHWCIDAVINNNKESYVDYVICRNVTGEVGIFMVVQYIDERFQLRTS